MDTRLGLVFAFSLVVVPPGIGTADAAVHTSLNLRYNDPIDPTEGGIWTLVALSDDPNSSGIADLSVTFTDLPAAATLHPNIGGSLAINTLGSQTQLIYSQDPNDPFVANVGHLGGPSDLGADPLFNPVWNNASVIATGAIPNLAARPAFSLDNLPSAHVNVSGNFVPAPIGLTAVRGDSVFIDGLGYDVTRNFVINFNDLNVVLSNAFQPGSWDNGDVNDNGIVEDDDLSFVENSIGVPVQLPISELPGPPPGPATISLSWTSRHVSTIEVADGVPAGTVFEFFATTDQDILSIDYVDLVAVPLYNNIPFGSNTAPPNPLLIPVFPSVGADSWITTPSITTTSISGDFIYSNSWYDLENSGPQTSFRFAQLTIPSTEGNGYEFTGRFNVTDGMGGVVSQEFTFPLLQSGDFDSDGDVDGEDVLKWQRGESFDPGSTADLAAWEAFYGTDGAPLAAQNAVPEPAAALLAALGLSLLANRRRRRTIEH